MFFPAQTFFFVMVQHYFIISHNLWKIYFYNYFMLFTKGHMNYFYSLISKFGDTESIFLNQDIAELPLAEFIYGPIGKKIHQKWTFTRL